MSVLTFIWFDSPRKCIYYRNVGVSLSIKGPGLWISPVLGLFLAYIKHPRPNLKNLSHGLNLSRGLNMVGSN